MRSGQRRHGRQGQQDEPRHVRRVENGLLGREENDISLAKNPGRYRAGGIPKYRQIHLPSSSDPSPPQNSQLRIHNAKTFGGSRKICRWFRDDNSRYPRHNRRSPSQQRPRILVPPAHLKNKNPHIHVGYHPPRSPLVIPNSLAIVATIQRRYL